MNEEIMETTNRNIPEIRVRKGSDAPSMGEIKGTAPLASADSEGLSEVESSADTDQEGAFSDHITSPTLEIPYMGAKTQISEGDDVTLHEQEDEVTDSVDLDESENTVTPMASPTKPAFSQPLYSRGSVDVEEDTPPLPSPPEHSEIACDENFPAPPLGVSESREDIQNGTSEAEGYQVIETYNADSDQMYGAGGNVEGGFQMVEIQGKVSSDEQSYGDLEKELDNYEAEDQEAGDETDVVAAGYEQFENEYIEDPYQQYECPDGGDDPFDLTYIEQKYSKDALETVSVERPRSTTPINLATLDDYLEHSCSGTEDKKKDEEEVHVPEKITINLPGKEFKSRSKSPGRECSEASWLSSSQNQIFSHSAVDTCSGDNKQILVALPKPKGPPRPPPPGGSKPGRPPPPSKPRRPEPPKQTPRKDWETFDASAGSPARPPPPKKSPARPAPPRKGDGETPAVTKAAAEDEAAILDSGEKKKSKHIKPGKALKVLVHGKDYKEKKEKKEKARQQQRELMSKYIKDGNAGPPNKEDSEEWKKYQEMLGKSDQHVESSKEKLSKMEASFEGEMTKLWGMPVSTATANSPWGPKDESKVSVLDAPIDEQNPPKVGWVGFEDDFSKEANTDQQKGSDQDSRGDILGLGTTSPPAAAQNELADLLGIGAESESVTNTATTAADLTDFAVAGTVQSPLQDTGNQDLVGLNLVDEFLGISSSDTPPPALPKDPLEQLKAMKNESIDASTKDENANEEGNQPNETDRQNLDDIFGFDAANDTTESKLNGDHDLFDLGDDSSKADDKSDPFTVDLDKIQKQTEASVEQTTDVLSPTSDDFDPRADISVEKLDVKPVTDETPNWTSPKSAKRARPRPKKVVGGASDNPFTSNQPTALLPKPGQKPIADDEVPNPFADLVAGTEEPADGQEVKAEELINIGLDFGISDQTRVDASGVDSGVDLLGGTGPEEDNTQPEAETQNFNPFETITDDECFDTDEQDRTPTQDFDPFRTITEDEEKISPAQDDSFDPFATISGDDAFVAHFPEDSGQEQTSGGDEGNRETSPQRFNPFDKEPPLDEKFANLEPQAPTTQVTETRKSVDSAKAITSESSFTEEEEELEALPNFYPGFEGDGWNLFLRLPTGKKKITQNRYWKPVYVRLVQKDDVPVLKIFNNEKTPEVMQELIFQPAYNLCDMGLQQYDQFGKCHTVKLEQVVYRERVGVKTDRIAPTLGDLARVRDLRGLKDLVHKPKTTMILDHAPQRQELFKFGCLVHDDILTFKREIEDAFFHTKIDRTKTSSYTKDEITVEVVDEYHVDLDKDWHIVDQKARVRLFAVSFLSGIPMVEVGLNDKRRRGKEVVGRHDIIPIKTEEWIKIEQSEMHSSVDKEEFEKSKVIKFRPLDAARYEIFRFRVRPRLNKELPLQVRTIQSLVDRHYEIKCEVLIPGYYSNSRRAAQTPCEDIQIHFPVPEPWIYYFRVEKHFRYGSLHSSTRKPGKIKGLERLTMIAKGILPPNLIEVSTGIAKYEHLFRSIVWRIPRLPERNEGAYKTHLLLLRLDLGPHDPIPTEFAKTSYVEFNMPNSTVSRAQVRSISISNPAEDPPDRWVKHFAKYSYNVEMEFTDQPKKSVWEETEDEPREGQAQAAALESEHSRDGDIDESDSDSSDSD